MKVSPNLVRLLITSGSFAETALSSVSKAWFRNRRMYRTVKALLNGGIQVDEPLPLQRVFGSKYLMEVMDKAQVHLYRVPGFYLLGHDEDFGLHSHDRWYAITPIKATVNEWFWFDAVQIKHGFPERYHLDTLTLIMENIASFQVTAASYRPNSLEVLSLSTSVAAFRLASVYREYDWEQDRDDHLTGGKQLAWAINDSGLSTLNLHNLRHHYDIFQQENPEYVQLPHAIAMGIIGVTPEKYLEPCLAQVAV